MRRILRIRLSFPRRRESSSYCRSVTSLLRHSPRALLFKARGALGEGGNPILVLLSRGCPRLLLKHRRDGCKFVRYWKKERLPDSQQSPFRWISSGGDRGEQAVL